MAARAANVKGVKFDDGPAAPGMLVRIEANGKRTVGRFVNRQFQPVKISVRFPANKLAAKKKTKLVLAHA